MPSLFHAFPNLQNATLLSCPGITPAQRPPPSPLHLGRVSLCLHQDPWEQFAFLYLIGSKISKCLSVARWSLEGRWVSPFTRQQHSSMNVVSVHKKPWANVDQSSEQTALKFSHPNDGALKNMEDKLIVYLVLWASRGTNSYNTGKEIKAMRNTLAHVCACPHAHRTPTLFKCTSTFN